MMSNRLKMFLASCPLLLLSAASAQSQSNNYGINTSHPYCAKPLPMFYDKKKIVDESIASIKSSSLPYMRPNAAGGVTILGALYLTDLDLRWPAKRVPYYFEPSVASKPKLADAVRAAAKHINERTFVRLTEISATDSAKEKNGYIRVVESKVTVDGMTGRPCAAFPLGYPKSTDKHLGTLWVGGGDADYCNANRAGSIIHEFLHALGMRHEQMHHYRDAYISISPDNLKDQDAKVQWGVTASEQRKISESTDVGMAYDFSSIMHYPDRAFIKESLPKTDKVFTVAPPEGTKSLKAIRDKEAGFQIGQRSCMSELDAGTINILYASTD